MRHITAVMLWAASIAFLAGTPISLARDKQAPPPIMERIAQMPGPVVPGVMVEVRESMGGHQMQTHIVQTGIEAALLKQDITVLDTGKPQYVVYGSSDTRYTDEKDAFGQPVHVCQTVVTLKITQVEGGKVVATIAENVRELGTEPMRAAIASLEAAANTAAKKVLEALKGKLKQAGAGEAR